MYATRVQHLQRPHPPRALAVLRRAGAASAGIAPTFAGRLTGLGGQQLLQVSNGVIGVALDPHLAPAREAGGEAVARAALARHMKDPTFPASWPTEPTSAGAASPQAVVAHHFDHLRHGGQASRDRALTESARAVRRSGRGAPLPRWVRPSGPDEAPARAPWLGELRGQLRPTTAKRALVAPCCPRWGFQRVRAAAHGPDALRPPARPPAHPPAPAPLARSVVAGTTAPSRSLPQMAA